MLCLTIYSIHLQVHELNLELGKLMEQKDNEEQKKGKVEKKMKEIDEHCLQDKIKYVLQSIYNVKFVYLFKNKRKYVILFCRYDLNLMSKCTIFY